MRLKRLSLLLCLLVGLSAVRAGELYGRLAALEGVIHVEELEKGVFTERYMIVLEQPLRHDLPDAGSFRQRVFIAHSGSDRPTVLVTEGYGGGIAMNPRYREELTEKLSANQILVEHRYFGESLPDTPGWECLTARDAAGDLHTVRQTLAGIYPEAWIATGISKGGTNALVYSLIYPDDIRMTVTYGAPVCFGVEDGRHEPFLRQAGDSLQRAIVREFQTEVLSRRESILPLFEVYCREQGYRFQVPVEEIFDLCVLEYSFSFWQWGHSVREIPAPESSDMALFAHLIRGSSPYYFTYSSLPSFFVQAARELGYYGYDTEPFRDMLSVPDTEGYLHRVFLPEDARNIPFTGLLSRAIETYYREHDPRLICIYGEYDPWTAVMPDSSLYEHKRNMHLFIEPGGSHRSRIGTQPPPQQERIWQIIGGWLREE